MAVRRAATTAEILAAAWRLADRDGLGGFSLREVAAEVSMQPPSLYSSVRSKDDLYDLMFRQVHDARVAALCLESGVEELWTADRDFSRFPALRTQNPLV